MHSIKHYPVGNGDCSLIKLNDGTSIIIDCQIFEITDDNKADTYDVKADLLKELGRDADGRPFVDLFVSTHPHSDHCDGFAENFYSGLPDDYDDETDKDKIIIGELWVTPMAFGNDIDKSAEEIRRSAKRRRKLYDDDDDYSGEYGTYLHIIGYDKDKEFDARYGYVPGTTVTSINGKGQKYISIFIHAPFKESVEQGKDSGDKNEVSIVLQSSFKDDAGNTVCKLLTAGDAEHGVWEKIIENNQKDENLDWNIFLAPHHCSWTFFNDSGNKEDIKQSAKDIMGHQLRNADLVTSCVKIENIKKEPPCEKAKKKYIELLEGGEDHFLNTAEEFDTSSGPIVFKVTQNGKAKVKKVISAAESIVSRPAPRAGQC